MMLVFDLIDSNLFTGGTGVRGERRGIGIGIEREAEEEIFRPRPFADI